MESEKENIETLDFEQESDTIFTENISVQCVNETLRSTNDYHFDHFFDGFKDNESYKETLRLYHKLSTKIQPSLFPFHRSQRNCL